MSRPTKVFVALGSNLEREESICYAVKEIQNVFGELVLSSVYESEPVGFSGDKFFNLVCVFESSDSVEEISRILKFIEQKLPGNMNEGKFKPRKLDIDLLLMGNQMINTDAIQIPRTDIEKYAFVLKPLSEIAPDIKHPVLNKSFKEMWLEHRNDENSLQRVEFEPKTIVKSIPKCH